MSKFVDARLEKQVLSAMIHDPDALDYGSKNLLLEDFDDASSSYIFDIMIRFYNKYYQPLSTDIMNKWLTKNDAKRKSAIMLLFSEIVAIAPDKYSRYYMNELKTYTLKRKLYDVHDTITEGLNNNDDPKALYENLTKKIITGHSSEIVFRTTVFDDVDKRIRLYEDKRDNPEKYKGVQYGFEEVDELTGGMFSGQLYMIMGRTGAGKSRMLFNIGCNVALAGKTVMYCTIEMEAKIIQNMFESRQAEIPLQNILRAQMSPQEELRYIEFLHKSGGSKIPFYIVDIPQGCTTGMIDSEVAMFEKIHGKPPDIVLIDYANLINPISKFKDRAEKYDHVFRELKEGSRAHKTIYYTAAQMNRESTKTKEPGTEHVAFSDASSYHCDAIFRVFADQSSEADDDIHFEVIKGRYHGKASISLYWNRELNLIKSWGHAELKSRLENKGEEDAIENPSTSGSVQESTVSAASANEDY